MENLIKEMYSPNITNITQGIAMKYLTFKRTVLVFSRDLDV